MCGLLAVVTGAGVDAAGLSDGVRAAAVLLRHRGPDQQGLWADEDAVLAFHRLVVVDPGASRQPLLWGPPGEPDRYAIALNGEVYNHAHLRTELRHRHGACFA